ncbi:MAG: sensor histidine kinase [Pseudonocardiales bacterium]|nr:MAG: sensor histidine kinase [Pseudonocardiales bacterium]
MTRASGVESVLLRRAALRLGLQAALLASAIVVLLSAAAVAVVLSSQRHAATTLLDAAVTRADDAVDPPAGIWLALQGPEGKAVTQGMPAGLPDAGAIARATTAGARESAEVRIGNVDYRIETLRQPDGTIAQGALDLTANHTERDQLIVTLLVCSGIGLLLAAAVGTWLGHRALRPLSAALTLQRRFVADAGHELRTPVTLLSTRAQLLRRRLRSGLEAGTGPATLLPDVEGIIADSNRLGEILEDLLMAADPVASQSRQPVDLTELANGVLAAAAAQAAERDVRLTGPKPDTGPVRAPGSPVALRRAVTALVDNAVQHAEHEVTVAVHARNGHVLVDVSDDGPGIDPELAPRLFERFVSGRPGPSQSRRRYGLGLALVSEIAGAHGGRVELLERSEPGAALRIQLPG